jgi:hypothetical protein
MSLQYGKYQFLPYLLTLFILILFTFRLPGPARDFFVAQLPLSRNLCSLSVSYYFLLQYALDYYIVLFLLLFFHEKLYSMLAMQESSSMLGVLLAFTLYINVVKRIDMEQYVLSIFFVVIILARTKAQFFFENAATAHLLFLKDPPPNKKACAMDFCVISFYHNVPDASRTAHACAKPAKTSTKIWFKN